MMPHTLHPPTPNVCTLALIFFCMALIVAGCTPTHVAPATPPPPTLDPTTIAFASEDGEIAAPLLVQAERNAAAAGDMALLAALWTNNARIVEARDPTDESDDYTFAGRQAVLDRYLVAVAQNRPTPLDTPPSAPVTVAGETATMINGVDTWTFVLREGRWWIHSLVIAP